MKLLELICQGIGSEDLKKFTFKGDYNPIELSRQGFTREIFAEVYNSTIHPSNKFEISGINDDSRVRLGVTFSHGDVIYRFVRDLVKGAYSLSKFDKTKNDFVEISKDRLFIEKAFQDSFKIPERPVQRMLYEIDCAAILRRFTDWKKSSPNKSRGYFDTLEEDGSLNLKIQKFRELLAEQKVLETVKSLEFDLDGLQGKLFEITDKLNKVKAKEEEGKTVIAEFNEYRIMESLSDFPPDIEKRLNDFDKLQDRKDSELRSLDSRLGLLVNNLAGTRVEPILKDWKFIASLAMLVATFAGVFLMARFRFAFLGGFFVFLVLGGLRLINFYRKTDATEKIEQEIKKAGEEKSVIDKKFDIETSIVRKFLKKIGVGSAEEALDMIKKHRELKGNVNEDQKSFEALKKSLDYEAALKKRDELSKEIAQKEDRLRSMPSASMDSNDLAKEVDFLRREIGEENLLKYDSSKEGDSSPGDPYSLLIYQASSVLNIGVAKLIDVLKKSFCVNLKIISGNLFSDAVWGDQGPEAFKIAGTKEIKDTRLLADDENLAAFFALQFTLLQLLVKTLAMPVLVFGEMGSGSYSLNKQTFMQAIGHLSKTAQVVHLI